MKKVLNDLQLGESIRGRIVEILPGDELLISFSGDLLRVGNETRRPFRAGDAVTVIVKAISPLRFQLLPERSEQRRRGHIDVSI